MPSPEIWPAPGNPDTRVRVFRIEVERPVGAYPTLTAHLQEAIDAGGKTFLEYRPDLALSIDMSAAFADPELQGYAAAVAEGLDMIAWTLFQRRTAPQTPAE